MSAPVPKRDIGGAVSRYSTVLKRANTHLPVLALIRYRGVWLRGSVLFFSAVLWDRFAEIGALHRRAHGRLSICVLAPEYRA